MDLGGLMLDDFLAGAILVGDLVEPILLAIGFCNLLLTFPNNKRRSYLE